MATEFNFNGKKITQPGSYAQIKSGIKNTPIEASYGNILIIDTGAGAGYGAGSGISGTLKSGKEAILSFNNIFDFRDAVRGGKFWLLSEPLFQPDGPTISGVATMYFIKAATTVPAEISYSFGDFSVSDSDSDAKLDGGQIVIQVRNEGPVGNGVEVDSVLTKGYAARMRRSTTDITQYVIDFYQGEFKGLDSDGDPFDFASEGATPPTLIASSPNFKNISTLITWMTNNATFNQYFKLKSSTVTGVGRIDDADLAANTGNNLATGGAETYSTAQLDKVLQNISELDYTFILCNDFGANAQSADNTKILSHLVTDAKYKKYMVVGGGDTQDDFETESIAAAEYYDSERVIVVHGGPYTPQVNGTGFKERDSLFKASAVLGRICGLEPQVPATFKSINIAGERHDMNETEKELALSKGVLHTKLDTEFGDFVINQAINSLQDNVNLVNPNGTSHDVAVERISAQLIKEIMINSKLQLLGQEAGPNRNTLSALDVQQWLEGYLSTRTATDVVDNLILGFQNITVDVIGDAYDVKFEFIPNFPVNKLFFSAFIIDPNL